MAERNMHWSLEKSCRPQNNTVFTQNLYGQETEDCYNKGTLM